MNTIQNLTDIDFVSWIITGFMLLSIAVTIYEIIGKVSKIVGKPVKWIREREEVKVLTFSNTEAIKELSKRHEEDTRQSIKHDEIIRNELEKLTDMFIEKQIFDMRWEINNFATKISENKPCNKDCFLHCFRTYEKYENILKERNMKNGEVEISMGIVRNAYQTKMENGEF